MGHSFLRHIQRTRLIVHLLDGSSEDVLADFSQINSELALYDARLGEKAQIVVFNKIDLLEAQARWPGVREALRERGVEAIAISAVTQQNTRELIQQAFQVMSTLPDEVFTEPVTERPVYELEDDEVTFEIIREDKHTFRVSGKRIERAAAMTYWDYEESILRFQKILETLGIVKALKNAGVQPGDTVFIATYELEWSDE